jgi:hypothetical protein
MVCASVRTRGTKIGSLKTKVKPARKPLRGEPRREKGEQMPYNEAYTLIDISHTLFTLNRDNALLNAAALLVASGNYTAEAAVEATFVLKELLAARNKKGKENNEAV